MNKQSKYQEEPPSEQPVIDRPAGRPALLLASLASVLGWAAFLLWMTFR